MNGQKVNHSHQISNIQNDNFNGSVFEDYEMGRVIAEAYADPSSDDGMSNNGQMFQPIQMA